MRRPYLLTSLVFSSFLLSLASCTPAPNSWVDAKPGQKKVLVSFPPLYAITHAVAGDNAYVLCLLTTQGPHEYEGSATDLLKVNKADLFIYNGLTLDDAFAGKMLKNHKNKSLEVLNVGAAIEKDDPKVLHHGVHDHDKADKSAKDDKHDHDKPKKAGKEAPHDHKHGEHDPHLWLGPDQAQAMAKVIAAKLAEIDPANKKGYEDRAKKFSGELEKIEEHGKTALKDKKNKKIITMHEAFDYFADAFGIEIVATIQKKPGTDPDGAAMAKLMKLCREEHVAVIAVEPQYSPNQAEALRASLKREKIDVQIITLDPLETAPGVEGKAGNPDPGYYLRKLKENIDTLAKALP
jgi:zinc transport system substrate-binding protein